MQENTIGILGKSNTGKTRNILFKEVAERINDENNLLILDNKKEYYNHFGEILKNNDYTIKVINYQDVLESDGFEPLAHIKFLYNNNKIDEACEEIKNLGLTIFSEQNPSSDPFWENSAADYFTGLVLILLKIAKEEKRDIVHFGSIANMILQGEKKYDDTTVLKKYCKSLNTMDPIYIALSSTLYAPTETRGSIISVVKQKLNAYFMRPNLLKSFYNDNCNIEDLLDESTSKVALFIIGYKPLETLSSIIISQVFNMISKSNKNMTFIIDGLDEIAPILNIETMIDKANSSNGKIKIYATAKNMDKLNSLYGNNRFSNIEKGIKLEDKFISTLEDKEYKLPVLEDNEPQYFDFELYVKKNN